MGIRNRRTRTTLHSTESGLIMSNQRYIEIMSARITDSAFREEKPIEELIDLLIPEELQAEILKQININNEKITHALRNAKHLVKDAMSKPKSHYSTQPKPHRRNSK